MRVLACSGSAPPGAPDDGYARLTVLAREHRALALVDANGPPLAAALGARPDFVTPNLAEAEGLLLGHADETVEAGDPGRGSAASGHRGGGARRPRRPDGDRHRGRGGRRGGRRGRRAALARGAARGGPKPDRRRRRARRRPVRRGSSTARHSTARSRSVSRPPRRASRQRRPARSTPPGWRSSRGGRCGRRETGRPAAQRHRALLSRWARNRGAPRHPAAGCACARGLGGLHDDGLRRGKVGAEPPAER